MRWLRFFPIIAAVLLFFPPLASASQNPSPADLFEHWAVRFSAFDAVSGTLTPKENGKWEITVREVLRGDPTLKGKSLPLSISAYPLAPEAIASPLPKSASEMIVFWGEDSAASTRKIFAMYPFSAETQTSVKSLFPLFSHLEKIIFSFFILLIAIPIVLLVAQTFAVRSDQAKTRQASAKLSALALLASGVHFLLWGLYETLFPDFFPFLRLDLLSIIPMAVYCASASVFFLSRWAAASAAEASFR